MYVTLQPERFTVHLNITIQDGGLLPHLFTMTVLYQQADQHGYLFSVALSVPDYIKTLGFSRYGALCCSDFPPPDKSEGDKTACNFYNCIPLAKIRPNYGFGRVKEGIS
ncbi:hypothetical protein SAMN05661096_02586 [Marivirga sericea]|uniref:Uncharacterized protein n=1 Tax=Marivirga sericea TaxID=1028 RepID=A0A1X7KEH1_9BACT|nr:hypothetical protein SAMN05661096_02586 [Marivirga sericea]